MRVAALAVHAEAMSRLDDLPPDQRAVLLLLVHQGKSHAEIAQMLSIPEGAVRERAQAGLAALTGGPVHAGPATPATSSAPAAEAASPAPAAEGAPPAPAAEGAPPAPATPAPSHTHSRQTSYASRRAGAVLLAAIVVAVVVVVVLVSGGGSSHSGGTASSKTTTGTSTTAAGEPHIDKQLNLTSPDPSSRAVGLVEVLSQGSKQAFLVTAEHLPPTSSSSFYAAWLYNSPSDARVLGRAPEVTSNGQLQAVGALPSNAGHYHQMLITRETTTKPQHPGPIVLSGSFSLH